jgi:hypothetical protein
MAIWKRLTDVSGANVDVNLENVAYIQDLGDYRLMVFIGGRGEEGRLLAIGVKESTNEIHATKPHGSRTGWF